MERKRQREFIKPTQNQEGENEAKTMKRKRHYLQLKHETALRRVTLVISMENADTSTFLFEIETVGLFCSYLNLDCDAHERIKRVQCMNQWN